MRQLTIVLALVLIMLVLPLPQAALAQRTRSTVSSPNIGQTRILGKVTVSELQSDTQVFHERPRSREITRDRPTDLDTAKPAIQAAGFIPAGESSKTVVESATPAVTQSTVSVGLNQTLDGISQGSPNPCGCTPPDPNLGVGSNNIFEMVNLAGVIYDKSGNIVKSTFPLYSFFHLGSTASISDPQVMYDSISGRWFASIVDIGGSRIVFAVSASSDPTGTFYIHSISANGDLPDQPFIGTSDDKFVATANLFDPSGSYYVGAEYWVVNKSQLLSGTSAYYSTDSPDSNTFTLRPARHLTSSSVFYMLTNCSGSCVSDSQGTTTTMTLYTLSGTPPSTVSVTSQLISVSTSSAPPDALQPGTTTRLATNDDRILSLVWESNSLWAAWADACVPNGDTVTRSCIRLVQVTTSGTGSASKKQDFDYSSSGQYFYYPALSSYQGQIGIIFGASSSSVYPSLLLTGQSPTDSLNSLESSVLVRSGSAADMSNRFGDYFGAATDPSPTSTRTFWFAGEYRQSSSGWSTALAVAGPASSSSAPPPSPPAPSFDFSISLSPSSVNLATGTSTTVKVIVSLTSGSPSSVSLSSSGAPAGTSLSFSSLTGSPSFTSTLTITASSSALAGIYKVQVTGSSGALSHSSNLSLTITVPSTGDFSLVVSPSSFVIYSGSVASTVVFLSSINGFSSPVTLTAYVPPGIAVSFYPDPIGGNTGWTVSIMDVYVSPFAASGIYTIIIAGTSGSLIHYTTAYVIVP